MGRQVLAAACAIGTAVLLWTAVSAAEPQPDPDKQCKKGYVRGADASATYDQNENGFVCVDPETGQVRDDKGQFAGDAQGSVSDADANDNGIVCQNDDGVYVDDDGAGGCPPGFAPGPELPPAVAADENHNGIVCKNDANGSYVDDTMTTEGVECPPGYTAVPIFLG